MPIFLLAECLDNAIKTEQAIPKIINEVISKLLGGSAFDFSFSENKKMRSREEIMKDYGLE